MRIAIAALTASAALLPLLSAGCQETGGRPPAGPVREHPPSSTDGPAEGPAPAAAPAGEDARPEPQTAETPVPQDELEKLLAGWRARQAESEAVSCRFSCEESLAMLARPRQSCGRIEMRRGGGYRRTCLDEKTGAVKGVMILKPPDLWVYVPELKTAEHYDLSRAAAKGGADPAKALEDAMSFDPERLRKRFKLSAVREGGLVRMDLAPLDDRPVAGIEKLRLWMKPDAAFPEKMETSSSGGDVRLETYSEVRLGGKLDESLFSFKAPAGVKVTEVTR